MTKGTPAKLSPMTLKLRAAELILVEDGRGGELQVRIVGDKGRPVCERLPEITNWLLPRSSSGLFKAACTNGNERKCDRYSAAKSINTGSFIAEL